jgi:hypothetical protein
MSEIFYVVPEEQHNELVAAAYRKRGYKKSEAAAGARFCAEATRHGIRTHNALKALHLDHLFGSAAGGCVPKAKIEKIKTRASVARKSGTPTRNSARPPATPPSRPPSSSPTNTASAWFPWTTPSTISGAAAT